MEFLFATLKALANSGIDFANAFSVGPLLVIRPQGCTNPGLRLANAFGVSPTKHHTVP